MFEEIAPLVLVVLIVFLLIFLISSLIYDINKDRTQMIGEIRAQYKDCTIYQEPGAKNKFVIMYNNNLLYVNFDGVFNSKISSVDMLQNVDTLYPTKTLEAK